MLCQVMMIKSGLGEGTEMLRRAGPHQPNGPAISLIQEIFVSGSGAAASFVRWLTRADKRSGAQVMPSLPVLISRVRFHHSLDSGQASLTQSPEISAGLQK